eukprot:COSAG01_NODE_343_length_18564_cov_10.381099_5_plen_258_part_00
MAATPTPTLLTPLSLTHCKFLRFDSNVTDTQIRVAALPPGNSPQGSPITARPSVALEAGPLERHCLRARPVMSAVPMALAEALISPSTRERTLCQLETHDGEHTAQTAMDAAPALAELMIEARWPGQQFRRAGLLLARLVSDVHDDPAAVYSAAFGSGRLEMLWRSDRHPVGAACRRRGPDAKEEGAPSSNSSSSRPPLGREDALNAASLCAVEANCLVRGGTKPWGGTAGGSLACVTPAPPMALPLACQESRAPPS